MAQVNSTDVFEFMGTPTDIRDEHDTMMSSLIIRTINEIELKIGRKIESTTFTNILFQDGRNSEIFGDEMFLTGKYRDTYAITAITENNNTLTGVSAPNDGNDYWLDTGVGMIKRVNTSWSGLPSAIKISGKLGMVDDSEETLPALKQIIIEMTAAKSGLWKSVIDGQEITLTEVSQKTTDLLEKMINQY